MEKANDQLHEEVVMLRAEKIGLQKSMEAMDEKQKLIRLIWKSAMRKLWRSIKKDDAKLSGLSTRVKVKHFVACPSYWWAL